jgi:hypothetical protein
MAKIRNELKLGQNLLRCRRLEEEMGGVLFQMSAEEARNKGTLIVERGIASGDKEAGVKDARNIIERFGVNDPRAQIIKEVVENAWGGPGVWEKFLPDVGAAKTDVRRVKKIIKECQESSRPGKPAVTSDRVERKNKLLKTVQEELNCEVNGLRHWAL